MFKDCQMDKLLGNKTPQQDSTQFSQHMKREALTTTKSSIRNHYYAQSGGRQ